MGNSGDLHAAWDAMTKGMALRREVATTVRDTLDPRAVLTAIALPGHSRGGLHPAERPCLISDGAGEFVSRGRRATAGRSRP